MALSAEVKRGIASNLSNALINSIQTIEKVDPRGDKTNAESLLAKQTAVLTIAVVALAQLFLEQVEVSSIVLPN